MVSDCQIKEDDEFLAEIQFQMNRLPLCEMHHAIDQLPDMDLVYPNPNPNLQIPWTPGKQWAEDMSSKLNAKQREAIIAITCPLEVKKHFCFKNLIDFFKSLFYIFTTVNIPLWISLGAIAACFDDWTLWNG